MAIMHRLKLVLLFIFALVKVTLTVKVSAGIESNSKPFSKSLPHADLVINYFSASEKCCYLYGSVPRNESNCVLEGRQTTLSFANKNMCLKY